MAISIKEVAAAAGMSVSSVSRILNNAQGYTFNVESQRRVWAAAEKLGYSPNGAARLLRQQKKTLVGLAAHFSEHPHFNRLLVAVRDELLQRGYEPVLMEPSQLVMPNHGAPNVSSRVFPTTDMLVGILSFGLDVSDSGQSYCLNTRRKLPLVTLHPLETPDVDGVYADDAQGIELLVDHLVSLGHRRIELALPAKSPFYSDHLKLRGWKKAVARHNLSSVLPDQMATAYGVSMTERAAIIEKLLLAMDTRPTAIICSGDESALSLMALLQQRGWNIPRDLSIAGYDGIVFGKYVWPSLTSVLPPLKEIARASVERLLELVDEEQSTPARQLLLEPSLLIRHSTAPPPRTL